MRYEILETHVKIPDAIHGFHYISLATFKKLSYRITEMGGLLTYDKSTPFETALTGTEFMELQEILK